MRNRTEKAQVGKKQGRMHNSFFLARALPRGCDYDKKKSWHVQTEKGETHEKHD